MATAPATTLLSAAFSRLPYRRVVVPSASSAATATDRLPAVSEVFDLWQLGVFPVNQFVGGALCNAAAAASSMSVDAASATEETLELVQLQPNSMYQPHSHTHAAAVVWIISGTGDLLLGGQRLPYKAHQRFILPNGVPHGFHTQEATFFLSIQSPPIIDKNTGSIDIHYDQANTVHSCPTTAAAAAASSPATDAAVQPAPAAQPEASVAAALAPAASASASPAASSAAAAAAPADANDTDAGGDRDIRLFTQRKGAGQGTGIPGNMGQSVCLLQPREAYIYDASEDLRDAQSGVACVLVCCCWSAEFVV